MRVFCRKTWCFRISLIHDSYGYHNIDTSAIYGPIVTTTNDVWVIDDLPVNPSFQKLLETLYHEKLNLVDFVNKHEEHLNTIAPLTSLSPSPLPKHRCYPSKPAHIHHGGSIKLSPLETRPVSLVSELYFLFRTSSTAFFCCLQTFPKKLRFYLHGLPTTIKSSFEIVGGGNATGYATGTFVEQGMADGRLSIVSKEMIMVFNSIILPISYLFGIDSIAFQVFAPYERPTLTKGYLFPLDKKPTRLSGFHTCVESGWERQHQNGTRIKVLRFLDKIGGGLPGVHYIRDVADADSLISSLEKAKKVVLVGGGYISMEIVATLRMVKSGVYVLQESIGAMKPYLRN
uniref:Uncharacterized protein n=1 Tax=Cucumis melo TaxID=3656 RepID=A0A9I9EJP9_CUCME